MRRKPSSENCGFVKPALPLILAVVLISGCATSHQSQKSDKAQETEVAAVADELLAAYFRGDTATLRRCEAVDWTGIGPDGKTWTTQGRYEDIDAKAKEGKWFPGGAVFTHESRTVRVLGNTAYIYGISSVKAGGEQHRVAYTTVWMERNGHWQNVHIIYYDLP
jgi:ketosteroid isomerase-like protein